MKNNLGLRSRIYLIENDRYDAFKEKEDEVEGETEDEWAYILPQWGLSTANKLGVWILQVFRPNTSGVT